MLGSEYTRKHEPSSIHVRTMHLTLIFIVIISYSTAYSHPLISNEEQHQQKPQQLELELESRQHDELNSSASRPIQQFFKRILSAFRYRSSTTTLPATTTQRTSVPPSYHQQQVEIQEIPNFVDFSTYLLDSFMNNNSAIKFSYLQPNTSTLRGGNYSVISFLVPHNLQNEIPQKGFFGQFMNLFRFPWNRAPGPPSDTVYSNFPPFLEYFAQRVQAYYSIYKYTDGSRLNNTIVVEVPDNDNLNQDSNDMLNGDNVEVLSDENSNLIETTSTMETIKTQPNDDEVAVTTELNA